MAAAGQETEEASKIPLVYVSILLTGAQQLKSALWYSMGQIVDHETLQQGSNATPQFIGALTEMVWSQIGTFPFHSSDTGRSPLLNCRVGRQGPRGVRKAREPLADQRRRRDVAGAPQRGPRGVIASFSGRLPPRQRHGGQVESEKMTWLFLGFGRVGHPSITGNFRRDVSQACLRM